MPKRQTAFDDDWICDARFSSWLAKSPVSINEAYCTACKKSFSIANGGIYQLVQHQEGVKHNNLAKALADQPKFCFGGGLLKMHSSSGLRVLSQEDQISRAEILFLLRLVKHNHSFASCDDLALVLRSAFNDPVASRVTLSGAKGSYSISHGIAPYFHDKLIADMKQAWYTLIVDETTTKQNIKQFDIHVRFWSPGDEQVVRRYLTSCFLGHATADDLKDAIVAALSKDDVPLVRLLHIGSDGPNVNKSLKHKLSDRIVSLGGKQLLETGSCNLHILHNAFHAGISIVDQRWAVEDLMNDVFQFFRKYPSRSEDFGKIQEALEAEKLAFKRYVSNRWLSVGPVCRRIITNWDPLRKYFLKTDHSKAIKESSMFKRICSVLQEGEITLARLHFIHSVSDLFQPFLTKLQSESTLIHVLYDELVQLLRLLLQRFVEAETLTGKSDVQLLSINLDCRPVENCEFGAETRKVIRKLQKDNNNQCVLLQKDMREFLRTIAKFLQERLPLNNVFLQNVRCLQPNQHVAAEGFQMITALANCLPQVSTGIGFVDKVATEWRLYQADAAILPDWFVPPADGMIQPVDNYWLRVSKTVDSIGHPKYSNLMVVVKAALSVSHGQADVERGFSLNNHIVVDSRVSLKQRTVVALRTMQDVLTRYDSIDQIPITKQLIILYRGAYAAYQADLACDEQAKQDSEVNVAAVADTEQQTADKRKVEIYKKQQEGEKLIAEASERLSKATGTQMNMTDILAAQALLNSGNTMLSESRKELAELELLPAPCKKQKKH